MSAEQNVNAQNQYLTDYDALYTSALNGNKTAQFQLFKIYRHGNEDIPRDQAKAVRWLESSAHSGHAEARFWLGYILFFGNGIERDVAEGIYWLTRSALQGFVHAQAMLGQINNGMRYRFYPGDKQQALTWYTMAAQQGHLQSIFIVGCIQFFSSHGTQDSTWFVQAEKLGDGTAMSLLRSNDINELKLFCERVSRL